MKKLLLPLLLVLTLSACTGTNELTLDGYGTLKRGPSEDPVHGTQTDLFYGALEGVNGTSANGVAYIRTYADGFSAVTVNLNIEKAPEGSAYMAKLENEDGTASLVVGELRSIVGDVRHAVILETKADTGDLHEVAVYLGDDLVADGSLKAPSPVQ